LALFQWTQEHSVAVLRFDSDHKKLFALINELNDAMAERRGRFVVVRVLRELADYARRHFTAEEAAMQRSNYPGIEAHIAEHRALSAKVEEFYAEYSECADGIPVDVLFFLRDWLQKHILETDRQYSECMNRAGIH
jgi:hemerythrin-like metal-binding protein